ncbi:FKBP-type peptidyl-prolyl cis-trans isomerase [Candidatus Saccharibacteria bacterium]|nr:FKBP-type peptidyl-prolyl cis-trans isomerase [Candidatus Saccharibacteria bacterium]
MAKSYYEAKTPRWQRVAIWIIAIAMAGGTLIGFLFMAIAAENPNLDTAGITQGKEEEAAKKLEEKIAERQKKIDAQNEALSKKYFAELNGFKSKVAAFEPTGIGDVETEDLKNGDGAEITNETKYSMYYIGWKPIGDIFDSSFSQDNSSLGEPLHHQGGGVWVFPGGNTGSVIAGWNEGVIGMKIGGVRLITIPADKAYTSDGNQEHELYGLPLKFIVMAVPTPEDIPYPKGTLAVCEKAMASQAAQYGISPKDLCLYLGYDNEEK